MRLSWRPPRRGGGTWWLGGQAVVGCGAQGTAFPRQGPHANNHGSSNDPTILVVLVIDPVFRANGRKSGQPTNCTLGCHPFSPCKNHPFCVPSLRLHRFSLAPTTPPAPRLVSTSSKRPIHRRTTARLVGLKIRLGAGREGPRASSARAPSRTPHL